MAIESFADDATRDVFDGSPTKAARRIPQDLWKVAQRKLDMINAALRLQDLRIPPSNRLEQLKGNLKGSHSIRINNQWRIIFRWSNGSAHDVRIIDYH